MWSSVAALRTGLQGGWNTELLYSLCKPETVQQILMMEWPSFQCEDKINMVA